MTEPCIILYSCIARETSVLKNNTNRKFQDISKINVQRTIGLLLMQCIVN